MISPTYDFEAKFIPLPSPTDFSNWSIWPGRNPQEEIPTNAWVANSGVWNAAPHGAGVVTLPIRARNVEFWRMIGYAKNEYGSPGRPAGPWDSCNLNKECNIGWARFHGNPTFSATAPGEVTAAWYFSCNSHDYPRSVCWFVLVTGERLRDFEISNIKSEAIYKPLPWVEEIPSWAK